MTDYADVIFVDGRNADHRTGATVTPGRVVVGGAPQMGATGVRAVVAQPAQPYGAGPMYYGPQGPGYFGPQGPGYFGPQGPGFWGPQGWQPTPFGSSFLSGISTGKLIDMVAQIFVALMPLPAAPVATSDVNTDVGNLILYQSSLASYAKRDEQVRTLGNLVCKLVG
jgi:hypothetical protein